MYLCPLPKEEYMEGGDMEVKVKVSTHAWKGRKGQKGYGSREGVHWPLTSGLRNCHLMPRPSQVPMLIANS